MADVRVLVVDDSVVIRKIVTDILNETPGVSVAGTASNGHIGLSRIEQLTPDLVILDIEMPVMTGLEALREIRKTYPTLPVVMFSASTSQGAEATIDALSLGASDYVTKPTNMASASAAIDSIRKKLIPKIMALCPRSTSPAPAFAQGSSRSKLAATRKGARQNQVDLVAIGISTGGPNALAAMLPELPADLPVPIVIVQHMPPLFTNYLAERLDAECKLQVREGEAGAVLEPGTCWIAPGGLHMTVERNGTDMILDINEAPPENHCRPAADVLFRSVASGFGARALGVVMTGMGHDGLRGCEAIHEAGGQIVVQDEASSVVWGMPGFVSKAGLAHETVALSRISDSITKRVSFGRTNKRGVA